MPGPAPKTSDIRQNRIKRPELQLVKKALEAPIPRPPAGLLPASKRRWRTFWGSPVAKAVDWSADAHRIERWIQAVDEYERVREVFVKARLVKGSMGQPTLNPLAGYLSTLLAEISKAEAELGLTPMARLRLGLAMGQARLTAEELNRALDEGEPSSQEPWEAEWQNA